MAPHGAHHLRAPDDWRRIHKQIQEQLLVQSTRLHQSAGDPGDRLAFLIDQPDHLGRYGGQV
jgi:hypothetical protein